MIRRPFTATPRGARYSTIARIDVLPFSVASQ
jgi:hypothetical protein